MKSKKELINWLDKEINFIRKNCDWAADIGYFGYNGQECGYKEIKELIEEREDDAKGI